MLYENIKKVAKQRSLSLAEVERRAGLSKGHIAKWKIFSPNLASLKKVASVLDVAIDDLLN